MLGSRQISLRERDSIVIGLRLNNYEIVSVIGQGGMGTVYLACHTFTGRKAAVKLLHPELVRDQAQVTRFMNEARATTAIGHPNIIDIIDVGLLPDGRTPYLMMEFLQGESLSRRLQRSRPLPIREAIEIACQTASALSAVHACDIIHRDLKPDNLFLVPDPSMLPLPLRVKVLDFGIAKLLSDPSGGSVKTRTGAIMGTPQYMSPEQCRGFAQQIGYRTDIYTLGIIMYEMVCGSPPFVSEGLGDMLMMHVNRPPTPPRSLNADVPDELDAAIMCALAKDPDRRFVSMTDFGKALRLANSPSAAPADMRDQGQLALARNTSAFAAPGSARKATALTPTRVLEEETAGLAATPTGNSPAISWAKPPVTTFTSTVGQVLSAETERVQRRLPWARRAVLASGVLVAAALGAYAIVRHEGPQAPEPRSATSRVPATALHAVPVLPPPAPSVPSTGPPAATPPPGAAHATVVAVQDSRPGKTKDKRRDKKGAKKSAVVVAPSPPVVPKASAPRTPLPVTSPGVKPAERW